MMWNTALLVRKYLSSRIHSMTLTARTATYQAGPIIAKKQSQRHTGMCFSSCARPPADASADGVTAAPGASRKHAYACSSELNLCWTDVSEDGALARGDRAADRLQGTRTR